MRPFCEVVVFVELFDLFASPASAPAAGFLAGVGQGLTGRWICYFALLSIT